MSAPRRWLASCVLVCVTLAACSSSSDGARPKPTTTTTSVSARVQVFVFFVNQQAFNEGVPPYTAPVHRLVDATDAPQGALDALFRGPTAQEQERGLRLVASRATGASEVRIVSGVARVRLAGGCSSGGSTLTVAEEIVRTLLQFPQTHAVKIYDPRGNTETPTGAGDSIPFCLEP